MLYMVAPIDSGRTRADGTGLPPGSPLPSVSFTARRLRGRQLCAASAAECERRAGRGTSRRIRSLWRFSRVSSPPT